MPEDANRTPGNNSPAAEKTFEGKLSNVVAATTTIPVSGLRSLVSLSSRAAAFLKHKINELNL